MRFTAAFLALTLPIVAAACGSPPPAESPEAPSATPAASAAPAASGSASAQAAPPGKDTEEMRRAFMTSCNEKAPNATEYCACGWEQTVKMMAEPSAGSHDAQVQKLTERIKGACMSKLPEPMVHASFAKGCSGGDARIEPYCECAWTTLRKTFQPAELADDTLANTERYAAKKPELIKACGAKVPDAFAHDAFMLGCASDAKLKPFCECAWKSMRTRYSPADFVEANVNLQAEQPKLAKECGKHKPK